MPSWVVDVGDRAVVGLGESSAREDVCRGEAGCFLDTVEEENLVGWRDEKDTVDELAYVRRSMRTRYLELGLGTGGSFMGFFEG